MNLFLRTFNNKKDKEKFKKWKNINKFFLKLKKNALLAKL